MAMMEVLEEKCATCIFRPGNKMHLSKGRVAAMVQACARQQSFIPCHETMKYDDCDEDEEQTATGPMCRGFYDAHGHVSQLLRIAERLNAGSSRKGRGLAPQPHKGADTVNESENVRAVSDLGENPTLRDAIAAALCEYDETGEEDERWYALSTDELAELLEPVVNAEIAARELVVPSPQPARDHAAYADPLNGGYDGYQAACWDCDWRASVIYGKKSRAQEEAAAHIRKMAAVSPLTDAPKET